MKFSPARFMRFLIPLIFLTISAFAQSPDLRERLIYYSTNLAVDKNIDALEPVMIRGANAGFNGIVLADSKFGRLGDMDKHYFQNIDRVKKIAAANKLQIIPCVFPIGYSESILSHDPNLAEGLPVRDALYVVEKGAARIAPDPPVELKGNGFKDLSKWQFHDDTVVADNDGTARITDPKGRNARVEQPVTVRPFRQYHISVMVKTQGFQGTPRVAVLDKQGRELNYAYLGTKNTQDWTMHHVVFNSLNNDQVKIYFGCWDGKTGTLEWKNPKVEETGLVNLIRRPGAPMEVKQENGQALVEGRDFDQVFDPRMGTVPWRGGFEVWHEPPVIRTGLPDGTRLRVSYYHAITIYDNQVTICPSEPKTVELLRDEARRMHAAWGAKGYFMSHDEIRVLNWDKSCQDRHATPGDILAENVHACIGILREVNPGGDIYVWSDMFDPRHNAHKDYYLVNGDLANSWRGLDKDVIIVPWNFGERTEALKWFEGLGNRMVIAGYYDADPDKVKQWITSAKDVRGVIGIMYTTWKNRYSDLEKFSEAINDSK
jgi:hypothetical protein